MFVKGEDSKNIFGISLVNEGLMSFNNIAEVHDEALRDQILGFLQGEAKKESQEDFECAFICKLTTNRKNMGFSHMTCANILVVCLDFEFWYAMDRIKTMESSLGI